MGVYGPKSWKVGRVTVWGLEGGGGEGSCVSGELRCLDLGPVEAPGRHPKATVQTLEDSHRRAATTPGVIQSNPSPVHLTPTHTFLYDIEHAHTLIHTDLQLKIVTETQKKNSRE